MGIPHLFHKTHCSSLNTVACSEKTALKMLSPSAKNSLFFTFQLGCFLRLIPYKWNKNLQQFSHSASLKLFNLHRNLVYSYTTFMVLRLLHASRPTNNFPLQQRILSASWTNAFIITAVGFYQLQFRRTSIMHFANRLLASSPKISYKTCKFNHNKLLLLTLNSY